MKITLSPIRTAIIFIIASIATTSYASPGNKHAEEKNSHHEHAQGGHGGGHMDRMSDIRQRLKKELGAQYNQPVQEATKKQLALGKEIYAKSCIACHGESGKGDGPAAASFEQKPADFTDLEHSKFYSDQGRIYIIKKGSAGTAMSGWEGVLSEKEIQSVYTYIRSLRSAENKEKQGHSGHSH